MSAVSTKALRRVMSRCGAAPDRVARCLRLSVRSVSGYIWRWKAAAKFKAVGNPRLG
jgi:hypothetical protein